VQHIPGFSRHFLSTFCNVKFSAHYECIYMFKFRILRFSPINLIQICWLSISSLWMLSCPRQYWIKYKWTTRVILINLHM
jgi:hypothetical protein